ncbi:hypothetical protein [Fimbriimonas ginsengisoli]|uniref:Uncharacterized protein n=1 Tax=Fimbriimonas ginsengisoli Gsoil 348 TaxID=661478 RepID=A0A068NK60_FIMGI|nr:hypothetical protein [Fimbriimonas ginsengisoli]AIE83842.1 hypothetical protein OP10G_0474 [Fimbriimonas ginsengisoli Gsoil 348]
MPKPTKTITPDNRVDRWKKLWATPRKMDAAETDAAFEEFQEAFVPSHMHKLFLKSFGVPRAQFGNRFFKEDATFQNWDTRLSNLVGAVGDHLEVNVIYGSPDALESYWLRGERRRSLRDIVIDDWQAACAIVRAGRTTVYLFIEPKMRGCIVRVVQSGDPTPEEEEPTMIEADEEP